jgi:hypothetical protein
MCKILRFNAEMKFYLLQIVFESSLVQGTF